MPPGITREKGPEDNRGREDRNAEAIEALRAYVLARVDNLQLMITNGVSKDDLAKELERVHDELSNIREDVKTRVSGIELNVGGVISRVNTMEVNVSKKIDDLNAKQEEMVSRNFKNIIGTQATAITIIVGVLIYVFENAIHH